MSKHTLPRFTVAVSSHSKKSGKIASGPALLRERKEIFPSPGHSVNTNENYYQFDVVLVLLRQFWCFFVLEMKSGK
ncbi:MAG TPA: hypothetical protein DDY57_15285 [Franconibacter pulveris]|jgi:hypothetical protein|nr:hypothetical protein [Franconibacter pulveris]